MKPSTLIRTNILMLMGLFATSLLVTACSDNPPAPQQAIIEQTTGGLEVLEQEFAECQEEVGDLNEPSYVYRRLGLTNNQASVESQFPHQYPSLGQMFPERGSWRQSKSEIMDIVDRHIYDPEIRKPVRLLKYFDMVLMINVADRNSQSAQESSAQRMQVFVRKDASDNLADWERVKVWPVSSGVPCGKRIATPTGVFKIDPTRVYSSYQSQLFDNADMYETMFLYHTYQNGRSTGVAIHGTKKTSTLGRKDSGGCVRLQRENSQCLFNTITGSGSEECLAGAGLDYRGRTISLTSKNGEADPEYLRSGRLTVSGYKVMVVIFDDENDRL